MVSKISDDKGSIEKNTESETWFGWGSGQSNSFTKKKKKKKKKI